MNILAFSVGARSEDQEQQLIPGHGLISYIASV